MACKMPTLSEVRRVAIDATAVPDAIPTEGRLVPSIQGPITVADSTSTSIAAANLERRSITISNTTASPFFLTFNGTAASATSFRLLAMTSITIDVNTLGEMVTAEIRAFQNSGGPLDINVLEFERA